MTNLTQRLFHAALGGKPITLLEVAQMFADRDNWVQVYDSERKRCWWAWNGPCIPPYEVPERVAAEHNDHDHDHDKEGT